MSKLYFFLFLLLSLSASAQNPDAKQLQDTARLLMQHGDYYSASQILLKALEISPDDIDIAKDLSLDYYFDKEYTKAMEVIKPLLDRSDADDQVYQVAGNIYKALDQHKEAETLYKKGIKRFSKSGVLYNDYGELLSSQQNASAINEWEKGIEMDPSYPGNYYHAARYYYFTPDKIWGIIYAEIFINIEPMSTRTTEIKSVLLDSYKKLFSAEINENDGRTDFEQAFLSSVKNAIDTAPNILNAETLTMIRTRFILNWFQLSANKFPYKLFDYQHQLLSQGIFSAYNQWLFGATQNLMAYQGWTETHASENSEFTNFQKGRIFKMPAGQYYHK